MLGQGKYSIEICELNKRESTTHSFNFLPRKDDIIVITEGEKGKQNTKSYVVYSVTHLFVEHVGDSPHGLMNYGESYSVRVIVKELKS